jgi:hypothetical protein
LLSVAAIAPLIALHQSNLRKRADELLAQSKQLVVDKQQANEQLDQQNAILQDQLAKNTFQTCLCGVSGGQHVAGNRTLGGHL